MAKNTAFGISVSAFKERLRTSPEGAYAFFGPEEMLKHFYLEKLLALLEKEGMAEFNLVRLDFSREATLSDLLGEAEMLPFSGTRRMILCRGLVPDRLSDADITRFSALLKNFPSYLILVLYLENEEFSADKKTVQKKAIRTLAPDLTFVSFPLQEERTLLGWSRKILASDGLDASDSTLKTLFRLSAGKMQIIRHELEKLSAYALSQNRAEITQEDVLLFANDHTEFAVYHLCDAVLNGDFPAAERILHTLRQNEVEPIVILSQLVRSLSNLLLVVEGADATSCLKATGLAAWQFDRLRRTAFGKKKENVRALLARCASLDLAMKGDSVDPFVSLEFFLLSATRLLGEGV